ncbi:hypothetical protein F5B22DRAFT_642058 [Xylaria bambusicola]|uniref:uncharacterized protein n=1 Tax=Xylaria bambusicola TaxID=326684 RepID=UPI002007474B|nr:uncharacterized protein F5B22DRAFT_642058 [Xylaria bambusicola]KAI0525901.1 hypothetical protein F5B22DRAFT_642058 [Xylaria bambusicola]
MSLSNDGNFLLTSDVNGSLSVWSTPGFRLTYQTKHDELVTDLAFSPDGTRLYDIRGSLCNAWEPDALIRADDKSSVNETITSEPVLVTDDYSRVNMTSLACERAFESFLLRWLEAPTPKKDRWAVFPVCDIRMGDNHVLEHINFSASEEYLCIASSASSHIWSLKAKREFCRIKLSSHGGIWLNHPKSNASIVLITGVRELGYIPNLDSIIGAMRGQVPAVPGQKIQEVVQISKKWLLMDVISDNHQEHTAPRCYFELLDLATLDFNSPASQKRTSRHLVDGLDNHIRELIGCSQDRVVFLDHQFWVCTWEVELRYSKHKRHFFLPKDWIDLIALKMVILNTRGAILCPKRGVVATIRSAI